MTMIATASRPAPHRPAGLWNPALMTTTVVISALGIAAGLAGSPLGTIFAVPTAWAQGLASASALGLVALVGWALWAIYGPPRLVICGAVVVSGGTSLAAMCRIAGPWALGAGLLNVMVMLGMAGWVGWTLGSEFRAARARMW